MPVFVTFTLPSAGPWALDAALDVFALTFSAVRRRAVWKRMVLGGVAGIEPRLELRQSIWTLHSHALIDATPSFDVEVIRELWATLTGDRGLVLEAAAGLEVVSPDDAAGYITKSQDWSPEPGKLPLKAFELLARANRGRHVLLLWGTARRSAR